MRACQDNSEVADEAISCSLTAITTVRTLPLIGADDIDSRSVVYTFGNDSAEVSNSLRLVHLRWEEPPKPNGIIHSYNIQHMRVSSSSSSSSSVNSDNKKPTIECISRASYLKNSVLGYKLELTPGNHSVQVRARSLFGPGAWTEELYIFVEEPSTSYNLLLIFIVVILALITVIAFVGLFAYKSYLKRMKIDYISVNPDYMSSNFGKREDKEKGEMSLIMCKSWERKPKARPTFLKIVEMLLDYVDIADRPSFLAVSYYHQWKTSRTEKESMAAAAAAQASAAAALEVGLPANTVMENKEADDEEDEDGVEAGKDETLIPLRQMSRSGTHPESEEEGNSDYSTYEDDEDDQLNEEDTNVHFFPLSRDVTSDVRLFNSPEEVPEKDKEENEKEEKKKGKSGNASPVVPAPSSRKGSKEPPALPAKTTSSSPKTLNVQKDTQKEKKSVSLIGLHELLPVQRSSSSRGAASGLLPKETEEKKGGLLLHAPAVLESASSQRQLHSGSSSGADSGNGSNPSSNNNSSYHHHPHPQQQPHHLSANPLLSSPALPPSPSASAANLIPSSSSTSNVNSSSPYPFGQGDAVVSKDTSPRLANKKQKPLLVRGLVLKASVVTVVPPLGVPEDVPKRSVVRRPKPPRSKLVVGLSGQSQVGVAAINAAFDQYKEANGRQHENDKGENVEEGTASETAAA
ncbi:hypothetical protein TYRP_021587 [Tyrophagus putrescentiae]|nr:hypothetical protein TYRP_021587 [Tyrophagus putrescentiae]